MEFLPDRISRRLGGLGNTKNIADLKRAAGVPLHWLDQEVTGVRLPGTGGNYITTPDSPAVSITGDIDIRVKVALDDWTPPSFINSIVSKRSSTAHSYQLRISTPSGTPQIAWSADGSTVLLLSSTVATGFTDGTAHWIRATLDVDNGAAGKAARFYTSEDGTAWTQLGTTVTAAGVTSIFDTPASVFIGTRNEVGDLDMLSGNVYIAEIRNGIDGPVVAKFDPAESLKSDTGETWTIHGSGWRWV